MNTVLIRHDKIVCPGCQSIETAENRATDGWPYFAVLVHECGKCGFLIGESEWQEAKA